MTRNLSLTAGAALAALVATTAGLALAQTAPPAVEDADGNGSWSMAELQAVWADLTEEGFRAVDADGDGAVNTAELQAAWDGGLLKPVEG